MPTDVDLARIAREAELESPSIVLRELPTRGRDAKEPLLWAQLDPYLDLPAASMIKVPIAAALCAAWASGSKSRTERVRILESNMTANDAESPFVPGYEATPDELGRLMITRSDNVATNTLIDMIGRETATEYLHSIGLRSTHVHRKLSGSDPLIEDPLRTGERNDHPAGDAALLFERIAKNEIPGAEWLFAALQAQEWNEKLSLGLRKGDRFAHKTGDTTIVSHDGGILTAANKRRYVIVVYTSLRIPSQTNAPLQAFAHGLRLLL